MLSGQAVEYHDAREHSKNNTTTITYEAEIVSNDFTVSQDDPHKRNFKDRGVTK